MARVDISYMHRPAARFTALIICAIFCLLGSPAAAEFIQTSNYFQSTDGFARVIPTELGIYFLIPEEKIPLQRFSINDVVQGLDAFLEYDKQLNRYTALHIGEKRYDVKGSFSLKTDRIIVKVDNYANPYCTVETTGADNTPSIIAFQAVTAVANYSGRSAVAILSANQVFEGFSDIHPYVLKKDQGLTLNGTPVTGSSVGLDIQIPESPCLVNSNNTVYLKKAEFESIRENSDRVARKKELEAAIKRNKVNILKDLILLKANRSIIAFDPKDSTIKAIELVSQDPRICVIKNIDLS